jgi:hypothetical protein
MPVISVRDLTRTYEVGEVKVHALRGVSLDIEQGIRRRDRAVRIGQVGGVHILRLSRSSDERQCDGRDVAN